MFSLKLATFRQINVYLYDVNHSFNDKKQSNEDR